jgi:predicted SAM-dependent methyltransferase
MESLTGRLATTLGKLKALPGSEFVAEDSGQCFSDHRTVEDVIFRNWRSNPRERTDVSNSKRRVLNAGSGHRSARGIAPFFISLEWEEVRLDVDPTVTPTVVGSVTDMKDLFESQSFDAVWSSHTLEHLFSHEVPEALREFKRVLKPDGFALITCPDLESVANHLVLHGADDVAYTSPAGPITPIDMLYGHLESVAQGRHHMAHKTGFTADRLGKLLLEAGFPTVNVRRDDHFELCALGFAEMAEQDRIQGELAKSGYDMSERS